MSEFNLLIDGKMVPGDQTMPVLNPATEEVLAQCPRASKSQLDTAVAAAKAAFPAWAATPIEERRRLVTKMAEVIEANTNELARLLTSEQGKPLADATGEVMGMAGFFRYLSSLDLPMKVIEDSGDRRVEAHRRPLGVVASITPWNFPGDPALQHSLGPALVTGNTMVAKPAPTTPLTTLRFAEMANEIRATRACSNVICDQNDLGGELSSHPDIAKVYLTGSTATGKKVMSRAASAGLKRVTLELGGNDAAIVMDDVDPKVVARGRSTKGPWSRTPARCAWPSSAPYVPEGMYDRVLRRAGQPWPRPRWSTTPSSRAAAEIGPVQNKMQYDKLKAMLAEAREQGTVLAGGDALDRPGYFIAPTIVKDLPESARLVQEEQFGPVLPVLKYSDIEDVIARGQQLAVRPRRHRLGPETWRGHERGVAATVWVNQHLAIPTPTSRSAAPRSRASAPNSPKKVSRNSPSCRSSTKRGLKSTRSIAAGDLAAIVPVTEVAVVVATIAVASHFRFQESRR